MDLFGEIVILLSGMKEEENFFTFPERQNWELWMKQHRSAEGMWGGGVWEVSVPLNTGSRNTWAVTKYVTE